MSFFLGKSQKIFQARFNDGAPIGSHKHFFTWGIPAVLFVQLFPLLFVPVAQAVLMKINGGILEGIEDAEAVSWKKLPLLGPLFLVVAYMVMFWAARREGDQVPRHLPGEAEGAEGRRAVAPRRPPTRGSPAGAATG
jgi:hypothetical protein